MWRMLVVLQEEEEEGDRRRVKAVSFSVLAQCSDVELQRAAVQVVREVVQELAGLVQAVDTTLPNDITVNGRGTFTMGGPEGDNGLSGKKLLLDYYGPRVPIGSSALSGKDFWKPDRAGALLARRLALAVVHAGIAREATVHFMAFPGDEAPRLVRITTPAGELRDAQRWLYLVDCQFSVAADWSRKVDLVDGARWGWFGRGAPREKLSLR